MVVGLVLVPLCVNAKAESAGKLYFLEPGNSLPLGPHVHIEVDNEGPTVVFGKTEDYQNRNYLYLSKKIELWDAGVKYKAEFLGLKKAVLRPQSVIRLSSENCPEPVLKTTEGSGNWNWNFNNPASNRDGGMNFARVSTEPFLSVGSTAQGAEILVVSNFGIAVMNSSGLQSKAIKFKKTNGETIICPYNEKTKGYDIPKPAQGHGAIAGPVPGTVSEQSKIGPATVILSKKYPGAKTLATVKVNNAEKNSGPFIFDYQVPDFYSASLGTPVYHDEPAAQSAASTQAVAASQSVAATPTYYAPDKDFPETWKLRLNPPILEEFGLTTSGPSKSEAIVECTLWKFGEHLFGYGGYSYSDSGQYKGGNIEGTLKNGKLSLRMTGILNMQLDATVPTSSLSVIKGRALVADDISAGGVQAGKSANNRDFALEQDNSPAKIKEHEKFLASIKQIPPGKKYWNALCVLPSTSGTGGIIQQSIQLSNLEQSAGESSKRTMDKVGELAHSHYCAWLETKNAWGKNHQVTLAHETIAERLYNRMLSAKDRSYDPYYSEYINLLKANGKSAEAKAIAAQMKTFPMR